MTQPVHWTFTYRCHSCRAMVQVTDGVDPHRPTPGADCTPAERPRTIEIQGVWLTKATAHNGNGLEVIVELADGTMHAAIIETADDGPISHYVHPSGILRAPVRVFPEPALGNTGTLS